MSFKYLLYRIGGFLSIFTGLINTIKQIIPYIYTGYYSNKFGKFGKHNLILPKFQMTRGLKKIDIGSNCILGHSLQLTLWENDIYPNARIIIGNNCAIGDNSHITAFNDITIGNNVLMGKRILITDNSHGETTLSSLKTPPRDRDIVSKGKVIIEDNVWIGEKASILPNVTIGYGSIIGANAVVTKNVPPFSVVVGNPARIIKTVYK